MSSKRPCSVKGCEDKSSSRHSFPNPTKYPELYAVWVKACKNRDLSSLTADQIYRSRKVCHRHFLPSDVSSNVYLKKSSVPTVALPELEIEHGFQEVVISPSTSEKVADHVGILPSEEMKDDWSINVSERHSEELKDIQMELSGELNSDIPSTSTATSVFEDIRTLPSTSGQNVCNAPKLRHAKSPAILASLKIRKAAHLSPIARKLYTSVNKLKSKIRATKRRRTLKAKKSGVSKHLLLEQNISPLKPHVRRFIMSQIESVGKSPQGRRFTLEDKILGIVMHKQSNKAYKQLRKLFVLPSQKILSNLLRDVNIGPGINSNIFKNLETAATNLKTYAKVCVLLFDEISLQPHVAWNRHKYEFEGFEDHGSFKSKHIANTATVFMLKGIISKWKQPIGYIFSKGPTKSVCLVNTLSQIIIQCQMIGFKILATISDQGSNNQASINTLVGKAGSSAKNPNLKCYYINDQKIVHIYDPPHLIKGIRNNLLKYDLVWENNGDKYRASWGDIINAHNIDNASGELRLMPKLTEHHVNPQKIKKMKVACATQVFSHNVAAVINLMATSGITSKDGVTLTPSALGTAKLLKYFDNLFDSLNGTHKYPKSGKTLRVAISADSPHFKFWEKIKVQLSKMYFLKDNTKLRPPSLKNWLVTINGVEEVFKMLPKEINFLPGRSLNQDPLENFFGQIRQRGSRNINPTSTMFQHHFKSLFINNLASSHSVNANCEEDYNETLSNIKNFVNEGATVDTEATEEGIETSSVLERFNFCSARTNPVTKLATGYVSGFIYKKLNYVVKDCANCRKSLIADAVCNEWHQFSFFKEYETAYVPNKLKYCQPYFIYTLYKMYNSILFALPRIVNKKKCVLILINYFKKNYNFNLNCNCNSAQEFKEKCIKEFVILCCRNWVNGINRIINGKECRFNFNNPIYLEAKKYCKTKK